MRLIMIGCENEITRRELAGQMLSLDPTWLEIHQRCMIHDQTSAPFYMVQDHCDIDRYYADVVSAPLYYGFGGACEHADRRALARDYDHKMLELAPETASVLLKTSPEIIRQRRSQPVWPTPLPKAERYRIRVRP